MSAPAASTQAPSATKIQSPRSKPPPEPGAVAGGAGVEVEGANDVDGPGGGVVLGGVGTGSTGRAFPRPGRAGGFGTIAGALQTAVI